MAKTDVPGIADVAGLARWLAAHDLPGAGETPEVRLILGGRSNLTYRLDFPRAGQRLVLRRPPLGHVLPTAHDMSREYRVLTALSGTDVPVPRTVALCQEPSVIGSPFYLMEWVEGVVVRTHEDASVFTAAMAGEVSLRFAEMLASIHGIDAGAAGLGGFGRPEGYLARQLTRWQRQWELSATREVPGYQELVGRLAAGLPASGEPGGTGTASAGTLVHGDYRLDNMLIMPETQPRITAVLDWEMATLGDPLADLGLALVYWSGPGDNPNVYSVGGDVTAGPGFLSRGALAERYAHLTGRDLSRLGYYMAFGCFKLAVVLEGIHARFLQRKTVGEGFEREGQAVPALVERAHELLSGEK
jgi:aminoglycoside phosphotransferase (APT) family kinase protein